MKKTLLFLMLALPFATPVFGQTRVTPTTNFPHDTKTMVACQTEVDAFISIYKMLPHPAAWTFYVVCDDGTWDSLMWKFGKTGANQYGVTDRTEHYTAIRGRSLMHPDAVAPSFIVAHEIAHIMLDTPDDNKADAQARAWLGR